MNTKQIIFTAIFIFLCYSFQLVSQNVGIGVPNPGAKLEVAGGVKISDSLNVGGQVRIKSGSLSAGKVLTSDANGLASWATPAGSHFIGESYGGGIVFYVYDNGQHGLIAATTDQSTEVRWYNGTSFVTNAVRDGIGAGMINTERIIDKQGVGSYAAQLCANALIGNYCDWYLPSRYELNLLYLQKNVVGGFANAYYWSSTEYQMNNAFFHFFLDGNWSFSDKSNIMRVRAIRAF